MTLDYVLKVEEEITTARAKELKELLENDGDTAVRINRKRGEIEISTSERLEDIFALLEENNCYIIEATLV